MMRHSVLSVIGTSLLASLLAGFCLCGRAAAEPAASAQSRFAPSASVRLTDVSAQSREIRARRPRRVRIYTPRGPGPDSVRICHSHLEYEHRLSGTVIVPRENCYWSG
jgi:hypothetical protein